MPSLTIREARKSDAELAVDVLRASITFLCTADHQNDPETLKRWLRNKNPETFQVWLNDSKKYTVVACLDGEVAGVGLITSSGGLDLCYIKPGAQGIGIGHRLIEELEAKAIDWGLSEINLISTYAAKPFYERHGYRQVGEGQHSYGVIVDYNYTKHLLHSV